MILASPVTTQCLQYAAYLLRLRLRLAMLSLSLNIATPWGSTLASTASSPLAVSCVLVWPQTSRTSYRRPLRSCNSFQGARIDASLSPRLNSKTTIPSASQPLHTWLCIVYR